MVIIKPITKAVDRRNMFYWQMDRPFDELETKHIFLEREKNFDSKLAISAIESGLRTLGRNDKSTRVAVLHDRFPQGSVNLVYKATLADKKDVVIRIHPSGVKNGYFRVESLVAKICRQIGVPTYETLFIDDSFDRFPFNYMLVEALPGENMKTLGPFDEKTDSQLVEHSGELLAQIHSIKTQGFGFYDNIKAHKEGKLIGIHSQWKNFVFAALSENLRYLVDANVLTIADTQKIETIFSKQKALINCSDPCLIQNDLADWNILTVGNRITGILDWDECYSGDPICDFSTWSVFFPMERMVHLKRGYQKISPLPQGFVEKFHIYRLRYIVSKLTGRKKKLTTVKNSFFKELLDYALKILNDEYVWFGVN